MATLASAGNQAGKDCVTNGESGAMIRRALGENPRRDEPLRAQARVALKLSLRRVIVNAN
jgi:hypothetical protein